MCRIGRGAAGQGSRGWTEGRRAGSVTRPSSPVQVQRVQVHLHSPRVPGHLHLHLHVCKASGKDWEGEWLRTPAAPSGIPFAWLFMETRGVSCLCICSPEKLFLLVLFSWGLDAHTCGVLVNSRCPLPCSCCFLLGINLFFFGLRDNKAAAFSCLVVQAGAGES